ncbi:hypothetical protein NDU88_013345 [Pleurodeles waltl]|uniref:Small ribosomal subunit protein mS40 n=1 Tax=Pleurodeles waltl TaxID=8319 RepID=A0AAV7R477_PLEWA|nr:hypothetical protein NDU88_013345 [Pleurodeles waltl]
MQSLLVRKEPRDAGDAPVTVRLPWLGRPLDQVFSTEVESQEGRNATLTASTATFDTMSRYKEKPWEYLTSEEYLEKYGERPVWADYRRNHKGGIPPQKTRKTCIRGGKVCGNPCPICRDQKLGLHHQNVKLLEQFISPYTGEILHPTRTGVCMKQQKKLTEVIGKARDFGTWGMTGYRCETLTIDPSLLRPVQH